VLLPSLVPSAALAEKRRSREIKPQRPSIESRMEALMGRRENM